MPTSYGLPKSHSPRWSPPPEICPNSKPAIYQIQETPIDYETITLPYIRTREDDLSWIYDILNHEKEQNRIVYEDNHPKYGFIMIPPKRSFEEFHQLVIVKELGIKSVRDLTSKYLAMLEYILRECQRVIEQKFGHSSNQLNFYFHYQPTTYHLHIHIRLKDIKKRITKTNILVEEVLKNLTISPNFYKEATLPFVKKEKDELFCGWPLNKFPN
jgi:m7GpppX diphosphatase